ncbi:MAG: hypothetical protein EHM33_30185 [Chloroflexi bacterium]|nr:MAG: hypothetical protein EHM33_30185 [Chloroflexota bacterium]
MIITDEMVEKALEAAEDAYPESKRSDMRAALEAVAPMLVVNALRKAIEVIDASEGDVDFAKFILQEHIQEMIDPQ